MLNINQSTWSICRIDFRVVGLEKAVGGSRWSAVSQRIEKYFRFSGASKISKTRSGCFSKSSVHSKLATKEANPCWQPLQCRVGGTLREYPELSLSSAAECRRPWITEANIKDHCCPRPGSDNRCWTGLGTMSTQLPVLWIFVLVITHPKRLVPSYAHPSKMKSPGVARLT